MPATVKDVKDYKYALVFYSQQSERTEVELFTTEKSRQERKDNLDEAKIKSEYAWVNRTY